MIEVCSCSSGRDGDLGGKVRKEVRLGGGGWGWRRANVTVVLAGTEMAVKGD